MTINRVRITGEDFGAVRERIVGRPDVVTAEYAEQLRLIGAQAVRTARAKIENETTKTGEAAVAAGHRGSAGRVRGVAEAAKSGRPRVAGRSMRDSFDFEVRVNKRNINLRFGWLTGRPGYAIYQEYGTKNGVRAMHALTDARVEANQNLRRLGI